MASYSETFPWPSSYGHYKYFEDGISFHSKVKNLLSKGEGLYVINRTFGDSLKVFICDCYAYDLAAYQETVDKLGHVDAIVINSVWCKYSYDAKDHCKKRSVGIFTIKEFMGALNLRRPWEYLTPEEKEFLKKRRENSIGEN